MIGYLLSFFYFRDQDLDHLAALTGRPGVKFFADSGAFSAFTSGKPISRNEYATWLRTWSHVVDPYVNLDVKFDLPATLDNQQHLEGLGLHPAPVFHLGESLDLFREMVQRHDFVAIGNLTTGSKRDPKLWGLVDVLHGIAAEHSCGLHGFGLSSWPMVSRFPWKSVDSSSMGASFRYGSMKVWDFYSRRWISWRTGDSGAWHRHGWLLREYGFEPGEFAGRSRKEQLVPLMRLAGATWAKATEDLDGTNCYLVDLGFAQPCGGRARIEWYEQGVQMGLLAGAA